jgi:hypothetical protein
MTAAVYTEDILRCADRSTPVARKLGPPPYTFTTEEQSAFGRTHCSLLSVHHGAVLQSRGAALRRRYWGHDLLSLPPLDPGVLSAYLDYLPVARNQFRLSLHLYA